MTKTSTGKVPAAKPGAPRLLHLFSRFGAEDPTAQRAVAVLNGLGGRMQHMIVSADKGASDAVHGIDRGIGYTMDSGFPRLDAGLARPGRLQRIASRMGQFDLVLSYGRGALGAPLAHTLFGQPLGLPPLIHHDDGEDETDRQRQGFRSLWYRRVGFGRSSGVVVPTETMEGIALTAWRQPLGRVKLIRDGVNLARFASTSKRDAIPRLVKHEGELWAVCFAQDAEDWSLGALIAAFDKLEYDWHLILVGGGADHAEISRRQLEDRIHAAPAGADAATLLGLADMVLQPASTRTLGRETLWAMAAGQALVGYASGEIGDAVAEANARFLLPPLAQYSALDAMRELANDPSLRRKVGKANRAQAEAQRDATAMIAAYRRLYTSAIERAG